MEYDVHFALISYHIGNSASFEVYVNILTLLSKADGKVDGQPHRLQTLLSRSKRVEELYHLASTDDSSSSRMVYAKYTILHLQTVTFVLINITNLWSAGKRFYF